MWPGNARQHTPLLTINTADNTGVSRGYQVLRGFLFPVTTTFRTPSASIRLARMGYTKAPEKSGAFVLCEYRQHHESSNRGLAPGSSTGRDVRRSSGTSVATTEHPFDRARAPFRLDRWMAGRDLFQHPRQCSHTHTRADHRRRFADVWSLCVGSAPDLHRGAKPDFGRVDHGGHLVELGVGRRHSRVLLE